jgi:hypothetical protein
MTFRSTHRKRKILSQSKGYVIVAALISIIEATHIYRLVIGAVSGIKGEDPASHRTADR